MNRKILLVIVLVITLAIPTLGCTGGQMIGGQDNPEPQVTPFDALKSDVQALKDWRVNTDAEMAKRATNDQLNALTNRVTTLEGQSAANTYTKAEVDDKISELQGLIDDLEEQLEDADNNDNGSSGDYGELIDSDGDLELWLERVDPSSDQFYTEDGENNKCIWFELVVVNTNKDKTHTFDLDINLEPQHDVDLTDPDTESGNTKAVSPNLDFDVSARDWTTENDADLEFNLDGTEWIDKDSSEGFRIDVSIEQDSSERHPHETWWYYDIRIRER